MSHRDVVALLPFYLNGTLAPHERDLVERELASCPSCAAERDAALATRAAFVALPDGAPDLLARTLARTLARIDAPSRPHAPRRFAAGWAALLTFPAQIALAAVLVVGGGAAGAGIAHRLDTTGGAPAPNATAAGPGAMTVVMMHETPAIALDVRVADLGAALAGIQRIVRTVPGARAAIDLQATTARAPRGDVDLTACCDAAAIVRRIAALGVVTRRDAIPTGATPVRFRIALRERTR